MLHVDVDAVGSGHRLSLIDWPTTNGSRNVRLPFVVEIFHDLPTRPPFDCNFLHNSPEHTRIRLIHNRHPKFMYTIPIIPPQSLSSSPMPRLAFSIPLLSSSFHPLSTISPKMKPSSNKKRPATTPSCSSRTLYDVVLPGTHDSAAYAARPELLSRGHILPLRVAPIRKLVASVQVDFAITQTLTILEQLHAGARFLDLRVSKRPASTGDLSFWTVHGMVLLVPLPDVIQQINQFHQQTAHNPVTIVTVFRPQQLQPDEEEELSSFVVSNLEHPFFQSDADVLRTTPVSSLPQNVIAGIQASVLPVSWGKDPWLDTYNSDKKIQFLSDTLQTATHRDVRNDLLVLGWTVTPQTADITWRVLSLGMLRPGVRTEAPKMNDRLPLFFKQHADALQQRTNVVFFDCFTSQHATLINTLNGAHSDTDDSALS